MEGGVSVGAFGWGWDGGLWWEGIWESEGTPLSLYMTRSSRDGLGLGGECVKDVPCMHLESVVSRIGDMGER